MKAEKLQLAGKVDDLLGRLANIHREDKEAERQAKKYGILGIVCLVGAFLSAFTGLLPLVAAGAVGAVVFFVLRSSHKSHDLEDRKIDVPTKVLSVLRADLPKDAPVELTVDFRDYRKGGQLLSEDRGFFKPVSVYRYDHEWLEVKAKLVDGTAVSLRAAEQVTRKEKRKRKYTKVSERKVGRVEADVSLSRKRYSELDVSRQLASARPPVPLRVKTAVQKGSHVSAVLVAPEARHVTGRGGLQATGQELGARELLNSLLWIFDAVGAQCRAA